MPSYVRQSTTTGMKPPDRHPGLVWIEQNQTTLPNNQWVAASANGLVATRPGIGELMEEINHKHIDPADVAIAFITSDAV